MTLRVAALCLVAAVLAGCSATPTPTTTAAPATTTPADGMAGMSMGTSMDLAVHSNLVNMSDTAFEHTAEGQTFPVSQDAIFANHGTQLRHVSIHDLAADKIIATHDVVEGGTWSYTFPAAGKYHAFDAAGISDHPGLQVMLDVTA